MQTAFIRSHIGLVRTWHATCCEGLLQIHFPVDLICIKFSALPNADHRQHFKQELEDYIHFNHRRI